MDKRTAWVAMSHFAFETTTEGPLQCHIPLDSVLSYHIIVWHRSSGCLAQNEGMLRKSHANVR
jgi:hypothetical protein